MPAIDRLQPRAALIAAFLSFGAVAAPAGCHTAVTHQHAAPSATARRFLVMGLDTLARALVTLDGTLGPAGSSDDARSAFRTARRDYKRIEALLLYFHPIETAGLNGPRIEDDDAPNPLPRSTPIGFQVVEGALFDTSVTRDSARAELALMRAVVERLRILSATDAITDHAALDAGRLELARIQILGLASFDATVSGDALLESADAIDGIRLLVAALAVPDEPLRAVESTLRHAAADLRAHPDVNAFNHLRFLVAFANPAARALAAARAAVGMPDPGVRRAWRLAAATLFDTNAFDPLAYAPAHARAPTPALIALGARLFAEPRLSGPGTYACASCHEPPRAFTDGRARAQPLPGSTARLRNTPTLLNVAFQPTLFADDRARSLETQIGVVLESPAEMGSSAEHSASVLGGDASYRAAFAQAMPDRRDSSITGLDVRQALAVYLRSLGAFDSRFDRAARGDTLAMSADERDGFRVFMGKARCATCHFLPLFNGVTPPEFAVSESEIIGVPRSADFARPVLDPDPGRYAIEAVAINRFAFKVPTLRNVALTAPYMHNGALPTLDAVVDFYDRGGGAGLGLDVPFQTLPPTPLQLTRAERRALVAFMEALSDTSAGRAGPSSSRLRLVTKTAHAP